MQKTQISVTRALNNLKLLDSKINSKIQGAVFAAYEVNGKPSVQDFRPESDYQSVQDLIKERAKLKSAIMLSNTKTEVEINGKKMSVLDAIELKSSIQYEQILLRKLQQDYSKVNSNIENINARVQNTIDELVSKFAGKDAKTSTTESDSLVKSYKDTNEAKFVESKFDIIKVIKEKEEEIMTFISEVDLILSEANAKTMLDV